MGNLQNNNELSGQTDRNGGQTVDLGIVNPFDIESDIPQISPEDDAVNSPFCMPEARILVVDDNHFFLKKLETLLEYHGFQVDLAATGQEGIERAEAIRPQLILLDIELPDLNGFDVCRKLKSKSQTRDIPVVFISADTDLESQSAGLQLGAYDYITKPVDDRIVVSKVMIYVELCKAHQEFIQTEMELLQYKTQRNEQDMDILQSQRIEAIGQLAAGLAHEINTPIQYISDNIRFMKEATEQILALHGAQRELIEAFRHGKANQAMVREIDETADRLDVEYLASEMLPAIEQSLDGVDRVASIVRAMKAFAQPGTVEKRMVDLNEAIRSAAMVSQNEWKMHAELETKLDPALPSVPCRLVEINQTIFTLLVNAAHAIHKKRADGGPLGEIKVSTHHMEPWAEIRIEDNGSGIPESVQDKIFDPVFSASEVDQGRGKGLAIAHDVIVRKHKGEFFFETEPGHGSVFTIRLPLHLDS